MLSKDLRRRKLTSFIPFKKQIKQFLPFLPSVYFKKRVTRKTGRSVVSGPFSGLKYIDEIYWGALLPKLLGTYEKELHPAVEQIIQSGPDAVIDIGTAEGYYAVGMASRLPKALVVCFEIGEEGRRLLAEMGKLNEVSDRLEIHEGCEPKALEEALQRTTSPAVICDVEGYENILLDPVAVPSLNRAVILVELHEFTSEGLTARIKNWFAKSHDVEEIHQASRTRSDYPYPNWYFNLLPDPWALHPVREYRELATDHMSWLFCRPKT